MHHKKIRDLADHMTANQLTTVAQLFEDYEDEHGKIESILQKITTIKLITRRNRHNIKTETHYLVYPNGSFKRIDY